MDSLLGADREQTAGVDLAIRCSQEVCEVMPSSVIKTYS
jgi:hypothetical protein